VLKTVFLTVFLSVVRTWTPKMRRIKEDTKPEIENGTREKPQKGRERPIIKGSLPPRCRTV
jgi:hypothetical protein